MLWICDDIVITVNHSIEMVETSTMYYNNRINFHKLFELLNNGHDQTSDTMKICVNIQY